VSSRKPGAAPAGAWTILALLALISATHQFHRAGVPALANQLMDEYDLSAESLGVLETAFYVHYTLAMLLGGWLADRVGTWRTLLLVVGGSGLFGGMTGCAGWLATSAASAWWAIFLLRSAMGIASAPLYPSTSRSVAAWFPLGSQPWANGVVTSLALVGTACAFPVLSNLSTWYGWRAAFAITGAATAVLFIAWALLGRRPPPVPAAAAGAGRPEEGPARAGDSWMRLLGHRGLLALTVSYAAVGYYEYTLMNWLKYYFKEVRQLSEDESAWYTFSVKMAFALFAVVGGLASSRATRIWGLRWGLRSVPMTSMTLAAAFLILGSQAEGVALAVVALALGMGFIGASEGAFWTAAVRLGGRRGATAAGLLNTGGNVPGMIAPVATPWIAGVASRMGSGTDAAAASFGWQVSLVVTSLICFCGVFFWLGVDAEKPVDPD
jgi:MFS family permease